MWLGALCLLQWLSTSKAATINFEKAGAIPKLKTIDVAVKNRDLLNSIFPTLGFGDTLYFPNKTFFFVGGVVGTNLSHLTIQIDGTLLFSDDRGYKALFF